MNVCWAISFRIRIVLKHIKKMCKRAQVSHQAVLKNHTQRQALFPVYHPACVLCKSNGKQMGNAEFCSHTLQNFPKLAQAEGKSTGPGVSRVSPPHFCSGKGILNDSWQAATLFLWCHYRNTSFRRGCVARQVNAMGNMTHS